jgi:hypothetical protein
VAEIKVDSHDTRGVPPPRGGGFRWWWLLPLLLIPLMLFMCRGEDNDEPVPVATDTAAVVPATTPMQTDTASAGATPPITTDTAAGVPGAAAGGTTGANPSDTLIKVDSTSQP